MTHLEIIRIRLNSLTDSKQVMILYQQIRDKFDKDRGSDMLISLLKNMHIENDWSIHLASLKNSASKDVSNLAVIIAETFRTIGVVNHDMWQPVFFQRHEAKNRKDTDQ